MKLSDDEILQLLKTKGESAMEMLYDRYYRYLCHAVYNVLKDSVITEDIVQEVFMEIWKKKEQLNIKISLKAYLRRASVNKSLNYIRDNKIKFEGDDQLKDNLKSDENIQDNLEAKEMEAAVIEAIDQLPPKCRDVFKLSRFEGKTYQEIADIMGISIKTVENQISKALKAMRAAILRHREKL